MNRRAFLAIPFYVAAALAVGLPKPGVRAMGGYVPVGTVYIVGNSSGDFFIPMKVLPGEYSQPVLDVSYRINLPQVNK
jgi:hypothetical protein